jgi:hypothetical protein
MQLLVKNTVQCHMCYIQFPQCLMDLLRLLWNAVQMSSIFYSETLQSIPTGCLSELPITKNLSNQVLVAFVTRSLTSIHSLIILLHHNERLCFSKPHKNLCLLLRSGHCPSSNCNATQETVLAVEELHLPSHDCNII